MITRKLLTVILLLSCSSLLVASEPVAVEAQPLASNVRRLLSALKSLGSALDEERTAGLRNAVAAKDAIEIQKQIDKSVFAIVSISPEERVSVTRGSAKLDVVQFGHRPAILKVVNHSTSTARLNITSPQAGPVYAGISQLSMQRQQQLGLLENQNVAASDERFLEVEVYDHAPMTQRLSGLEVEYVLVLLGSTEAGKREAVLHFDVGDDTADLEHRNELPVLLDTRPAMAVKLSVHDERGNPTIARIEIRDAQGRVYPPQAKRLAPDFYFQPHVYRGDGETVLLPPGHYDVQYGRGPEYRVLETTLTINHSGENHFPLKLQRWFNANDYGYFSGDHHIHAAGCAHYTSPTQGVTPQDMFRQVQGEGLNVGCVLTWGPCFDFQRNYFNAQADLFGTNDTLLKYDLEISGFGSQALGHVCLLNLKDQTYPKSEGTKTKGWPTWTTPVMRWAKEQGGYAGYAHSASGLHIQPESASNRLIQRYDQNKDGSLSDDEARNAFLPAAADRIDRDQDGRLSRDELIQSHRWAAQQLPNLAIPEMNGVGAMEICVSTAAGVCDFISAMDTRRIQEWNTWYHLMNCGFPLKVSGETDFPCMSSRRVGKGRVYVHLGKGAKLDFAQWCAGLAAGRSYVSDGYAHIGKLTVNDVAPGYGKVFLEAPGKVRFCAAVAFAPRTPKAVSYGTVDVAAGRAVIGDTVVLHKDREEKWIEGGMRKIEIIANGNVVDSVSVPADGKVHQIDREIEIDQSSWVALRHFPQLHSNPVNVIVDEKPIRASRLSARWCIEMTELLWKNRQRNIAAEERDAAKEAFDFALDKLREIAQQCAEGT